MAKAEIKFGELGGGGEDSKCILTNTSGTATYIDSDYVTQIDYIAHSKGNNWYHLFVHCGLYTLPFYVAFGLSWHLAVIFAVHFIVDMLKARYEKINYLTDQVFHYLTSLVYLV
jgi:hypothetical protein